VNARTFGRHLKKKKERRDETRHFEKRSKAVRIRQPDGNRAPNEV
jgi:hypothetical protein